MIAKLYQWCYAYLTDYMHPCVVISIIVLITTGFIAIGFVLIRTVFDWIGEKWHDATIKLPKDISNANIPMNIEMIS